MISHSKCKEIGLQKKKLKIEKQKERRHAARKIIFNIEKTRKKTPKSSGSHFVQYCMLFVIREHKQ